MFLQEAARQLLPHTCVHLKRRHDKQLYRGFRFDIFVNFQMAIERVHAVEAGRSFRAGHLESEQARGTVALDKDWALSTAVA